MAKRRSASAPRVVAYQAGAPVGENRLSHESRGEKDRTDRHSLRHAGGIRVTWLLWFCSRGRSEDIRGPSNPNTSSSGRGVWSGSTNNVTLYSAMTNGGANYCITTYFDWKVSDGLHHDSRGLRVCQNVIKNAVWNDVSVVTGMQKFGACYRLDDMYGWCKQGVGYDLPIPTQHYAWSSTSPDRVIDAWTWKSNGSWEWNPGGNPRSGSS